MIAFVLKEQVEYYYGKDGCRTTLDIGKATIFRLSIKSNDTGGAIKAELCSDPELPPGSVADADGAGEDSGSSVADTQTGDIQTSEFTTVVNSGEKAK